MKKPHEQELYLDAYGDICRGQESIATRTNGSREDMQLMCAAPDMARALISCREHLCCSDGCRCDVCAALAKAGVFR